MADRQARPPAPLMDLGETVSGLDLRTLLRVLAERPLMPSDLDEGSWRSMVWVVTSRIQGEGQSLDPAGWAACSAVVVDLLDSAVEAGAYSRREVLVRRLNLTCVALDHARHPHPEAVLLDPVSAIDEVLEELPADVEAVADDASHCWDRPVDLDGIRRLRRIKNLLTPALRLGRQWGDDRLDRWGEVYLHLP